MCLLVCGDPTLLASANLPSKNLNRAPGIVNQCWKKVAISCIFTSFLACFDFHIWSNCPTTHRFLKVLSWKTIGFPQKVVSITFSVLLIFCTPFSDRFFVVKSYHSEFLCGLLNKQTTFFVCLMLSPPPTPPPPSLGVSGRGQSIA